MSRDVLDEAGRELPRVLARRRARRAPPSPAFISMMTGVTRLLALVLPRGRPAEADHVEAVVGLLLGERAWRLRVLDVDDDVVRASPVAWRLLSRTTACWYSRSILGCSEKRMSIACL